MKNIAIETPLNQGRLVQVYVLSKVSCRRQGDNKYMFLSRVFIQEWVCFFPESHSGGRGTISIFFFPEFPSGDGGWGVQ